MATASLTSTRPLRAPQTSLFISTRLASAVHYEVSLSHQTHPCTVGRALGSARVRDLWTHKDLGVFERSFTAENVPIHGTAFLKITPL